MEKLLEMSYGTFYRRTSDGQTIFRDENGKFERDLDKTDSWFLQAVEDIAAGYPFVWKSDLINMQDFIVNGNI